MSQIIRTYCDCCGQEIDGRRGWEDAPCTIELKLSYPAQNYESKKFEHVCFTCRRAIVAAVDAIAERKSNQPARTESAEPNAREGGE